jgi:aminoglycoside phosphotransferase (APT) family kinase protein
MDAYTGTKPVADSHAFDIAALQAHLQAALPGFAGPLQVEQFKGGQSNPTYKLVTPSRSYVMRTKPGPAAKLLPSAHAIEREFRVMRALHGSAVPVPEMLLLCEDESVIGRAFYLMEFIPGRVLWEQSLPGFEPAERGRLYDEMNRVIAALHQVDVAAAGLADYGKPGNYFERQIGRWTKQYQASITQPIDAMDRLMEWLPAHMPPSARDESQVSVVHGDYRLDNLVFHAQEPRVIGVLDWELSTLGHPMSDLAYQCMSWHVPPALWRGLGGLDLEALGIPSEREYMTLYGPATHRVVAEHWDFYLAYSLFRMAAILYGISARAAQGNASAADAQEIGQRAGPLADLAWQRCKASNGR